MHVKFGTAKGHTDPLGCSGVNLKKKVGGGAQLQLSSGLHKRMGSAERLSEWVRAEPGRQMSFGAFLPLT